MAAPQHTVEDRGQCTNKLMVLRYMQSYGVMLYCIYLLNLDQFSSATNLSSRIFTYDQLQTKTKQQTERIKEDRIIEVE